MAVMDFRISTEELDRWCSYKPDEIKSMKNLNAELRVRASVEEALRAVGNIMADEISANNAAGRPTKWICPVGPLDQYKTFVERVNRERISLKNLWMFMMDEFLDWESRLLPEDSVYGSLRGTLKRRVLSEIDPELAPLRERVIFPDPGDLDAYDRKIEELGGIDTVWAGVGTKGMVAFCEAPHFEYHRISYEQFRNGRARIVTLGADTVIALGQRAFGAYYDHIPPMAVTLGMNALLSSRRIVYMLREGAWKQTVLRVMLFCGNETLEYPVTFTVRHIPEKILYCDELTLEHPLSRL
jgi:glucosamine-6-phosphate deaminase